MIEQEIIFMSGELIMAGTLALPDSEGLFAGVLLVPGSGQVDRNENHWKLRIGASYQIASYLADHGIATLRYDKRGIGASDGNYWETGFFDNVSDASLALGYLKAHKMIEPEKVFLLGHSEGALISTRLAADGTDVAGVILVAGSAQRGEDVFKWKSQWAAGGEVWLNKWLMKLMHYNVQKAQQIQLDKIKRSSKDWFGMGTAKVNAKWMREFLAYNPSEDLPKIRVPVLAMTGSKDIQVNPEDLKLMAELVKTDFEYHELPDVTHILRVDEGEPTLSTYKKQALKPIDSRILHIILEWLKKQIDVQR